MHLFGRSLIAVGLAMVVVGFLGTLLQVGRRIAAAAHPAGRARAA